MEYTFRLVDYNVYTDNNKDDESSGDDQNKYKDTSTFVIQMFGDKPFTVCPRII